jgi:MFS family permease
MRNALRPVAALLIGVAILLTGQGLQGTLLPVRAGIEAFSTLSIGVMGAGYFLGFTLGCMKGGELVKRVGHVRVFAAMTALASATPLVHGLVISAWAWSLFRVMTGFCLAVLYVVIESWLNERATNENRGIIFSTYVMITLSMMAVGQMMTLLYQPTEFQLFAITSVLVSLAAIPVALSTSPSPEPPQTVDVDLKRLFRISRSGSLGCLAAGLANGAFWGLAPVFTASVSDNVSLAAWYMSSAVVGGALAQWPLGMLSDRLGRRKVLMIAAGSSAAIGVMTMMVAGNAGFLGVNLLGAAWGFVAFPVYGLSVAHANDFAEADDYVMLSSGLLLMYGGGAIAGPFLASAVMTIAGGSAMYAYTAVVHVILALYVLNRIFRRESAPAEHQMAYGDALAAAHTASHVYEEELQQAADEES